MKGTGSFICQLNGKIAEKKINKWICTLTQDKKREEHLLL